MAATALPISVSWADADHHAVYGVAGASARRIGSSSFTKDWGGSWASFAETLQQPAQQFIKAPPVLSR